MHCRSSFCVLGLMCLLGPVFTVHGGGSGLNVAVVINQARADSVQLGNYYCERRNVPSQNVLRITWPGSLTDWSYADFAAYLLNPLVTMLSARELTNQIDYVVLSMGIPYRVTRSGSPGISGVNSTTSALFYGFQPDPITSFNPASCGLPDGSFNAYAGTESPFRLAPPVPSGPSFLTMMITGTNLPAAKAIVDQGVAGDCTYPTQRVVLGKSADWARNVRYALYDNAIFNTRVAGNYTMVGDNSAEPFGMTNLLGYFNGMYQFRISPRTFVPGAMADSLTSYGGVILDPNNTHTTLLAFLEAGASGSYGTVVEPCNYLVKFPSPQNYFYQARGFSVAECYYQSLTNPYQGVLVGEPLSAPFAQPGNGEWLNLPDKPVLTGSTNLAVRFSIAAPRTLQQIDLFLDGTFVRTLTNVPATQSNVIQVLINGIPNNYTVPTNPTLQSISTGLAARLNQSGNVTKLRAVAVGDRVELHSTNSTVPGATISISASTAIGKAPALTTGVTASRSTFLDTTAHGIRSFVLRNAPALDDFLKLDVTLTNGSMLSFAVTNTGPGVNLTTLVQTLAARVNADPALAGAAGLVVEDVVGFEWGSPPEVDFNIRARAPGWQAAQIQTALTGSPGLNISPSGNLDENLEDLQPRNHLYVSAGLRTLDVTFNLDTASLPDGSHELTAVAYEGSHVRTQTRVSRQVLIQNTSVSAIIGTPFTGTNVDASATFQFKVTANTPQLSKIELFSTGGSLGTVSNTSTATFNVNGTDLGVGLHPFYSVVTANSGKQFRTETKWLRLVGTEPGFNISLGGPPYRLSWPGTIGRTYDILSATNVGNPFAFSGRVIATNSPAIWADTNAISGARFYRVLAAGGN